MCWLVNYLISLINFLPTSMVDYFVLLNLQLYPALMGILVNSNLSFLEQAILKS